MRALGQLISMAIALIISIFLIEYVGLWWGLSIIIGIGGWIALMTIIVWIRTIFFSRKAKGRSISMVIRKGNFRASWRWPFGYPIILWNHRIIRREFLFNPSMWLDPVQYGGNYIQKLWGFTVGLCHPHKRSIRQGFFAEKDKNSWIFVPYAHGSDNSAHLVFSKSESSTSLQIFMEFQILRPNIMLTTTLKTPMGEYKRISMIPFKRIPWIGWKLSAYIEFDEGVGAPQEMLFHRIVTY